MINIKEWYLKIFASMAFMAMPFFVLTAPIVYAQESVSSYNQFVLPTDALSGGETCTGPTSSSANIFVTAKNSGWLYSGFIYSAFLTTLDQYTASHGGSSAFTWASDTPINTKDLFTLSACDYSYCILQKIFGQMPGLFYASGSPICPETPNLGPESISNLLRLMNIGIFTVVCLMVSYGLIGKGVIIGGFEGDILQKNFTLATASRIAVAMFSIIPMPGIGYSAMQNFMMYIVLLGVGFADSTFRVGLNAYLSYGAVFSFSGLGDSNVSQDSGNIDFTRNNVQTLFNTSSSPDGAKYASIMDRVNCAYYQVLKDKITNYTPYDTSIPNDAITSIFTSPGVISFSDVISIDAPVNATSVTINFGNYSGEPPDIPQCGSITWAVPSGQSATDFTNTPAYMMLQALYQQTGQIFYNTNYFFLNGIKTAVENDYYTCLQGTSIMSDGLIIFTTVGGKTLFRPMGVICTYDPSTTVRQDNLKKYVELTAPYATNNQINWESGCSGNCLTQYSNKLIDAVADILSVGGSDVTKQMSTSQLMPFVFTNGTAAGNPTSWVINTSNDEFSQSYIGDLLLLTEDYNQLSWSLTQNIALPNIYSNIVSASQKTSGSYGTATLSSSMNTNSLNLMTQSMLAPFFGSNPVSFFKFMGKILTWRNLAISASNFTTSLMMIMQRLIGFYYYDNGTVMTLNWYASEGKNNSPSASSNCKGTYQSACMGSDISNCYNAMDSAGCFMNKDGIGRGLLGSAALMYNVGTAAQDSKIVLYNPLADYIEIGYTVLTAATYYLFQNNMEVIALYVELAGINMGINAAFTLTKGIILQFTGPMLPPWCPRYCKQLITAAIDTPKMIVDYFVQLDQDRIGFYNNLGTTFMVLFIPFGAILTILLPLYPTLIFIVGIFGWIVSVIEALIAGPMVAVGLCHPEGSDFLGKAEMGMGILFQTFLRPVLIVLGVFLSISVINLAFYAFNIAYATQYANLAGGVNSPLGSAMHLFQNWEINIAVVLCLVMLYAYVAWQIISHCCVNMISFSNQVLAWVSSGSDSRFTSTVDILAATKEQVQSNASAIGSGLRSASGSTEGLGRESLQIGQETAAKRAEAVAKENRGFYKESADGPWKSDPTKIRGSIFKLGKHLGNVTSTPFKIVHVTAAYTGKAAEKVGLLKEGRTDEMLMGNRHKLTSADKSALDKIVKAQSKGVNYFAGSSRPGFKSDDMRKWAKNIRERKDKDVKPLK